MKLLKYIHLFYVLIVASILFILFCPIFYLLSRKEKYYLTLNYVRYIWSICFFFLIGIIIRIDGKSNIKKGQKYIYCANHASYLDIPFSVILAHCIGDKYCFVGKVELLKNPICIIFFKTIDITVNRQSRIQSARSLIKCKETIDKGYNLILFPEGSIPAFEDAPTMIDFKDGAFALSVQANVPVLPITFKDNWKLMHNYGEKTGSKIGISRAYFHKPIYASKKDEEKQAEELKKQVYQTIQSGL